MIAALSKADIILFGELHDNAINHWLEWQITKDVYALRQDMVIGMEMFEADDQIVLDEYLNGTIEERHLLSEAKVWDNYRSDYRPLVEFAREKQLKVIATNIPRRYASLVFREGITALDSLDKEAKRWIAPLPVKIDLTLPGYKSLGSMEGHGTNAGKNHMAPAQAVKDATMAHFIMKYRNGIFMHLNGAYHSKNYEGIQWYLRQEQQDLKIVTIHTVEQRSVDRLEKENLDTADFIIGISSDDIH
jgi:uncharacterized iron-regulated protein